jgi:hypothetical protein
MKIFVSWKGCETEAGGRNAACSSLQQLAWKSRSNPLASDTSRFHGFSPANVHWPLPCRKCAELVKPLIFNSHVPTVTASEVYYYGCDALFTRHPDLIHQMCLSSVAAAPAAPAVGFRSGIHGEVLRRCCSLCWMAWCGAPETPWMASAGWLGTGPGVTTQNVLRDVGVNYQ